MFLLSHINPYTLYHVHQAHIHIRHILTHAPSHTDSLFLTLSPPPPPPTPNQDMPVLILTIIFEDWICNITLTSPSNAHSNDNNSSDNYENILHALYI